MPLECDVHPPSPRLAIMSEADDDTQREATDGYVLDRLSASASMTETFPPISEDAQSRVSSASQAGVEGALIDQRVGD